MNDEARNLTLLALPVPPMLEAALAYDGPARWVSFWWEPQGDMARWSDGCGTGEAAWYAYRTFLAHPAVQAALAEYELGSSETLARHSLLLDRDTRQLFVAPKAVAARFLGAQWTPPGELPLGELLFGSVVERPMLVGLRPRTPPPDRIALIAARMQHAEANRQALQRWLAEQLPPDPARPWELIEQTLAAWARGTLGAHE